jgi:MYXO-CTERM domain-containing protein
MVKRAFFLGVLMALAQPAAATQMVNLAPPERAAAPANCPAEDPACTTGGGAGAQATSDIESGSSGPIIAGLLGLLVLGAVFGRRKSGLPEVVS